MKRFFILSISCFWFGIVQAAIAQPIQRSFFAAPPPPSGIGAPGQRSDAGSRPQSCKQVEQSLTAIVPVYSTKDADFVWGLTTMQQPSLWFYVPYTSNSASGELVVENSANQQTVVKVPLLDKPGIMQIPLAGSNISLEAGKQYRWYFNVYCRNSDEVDSFVEGSLTRQAVNSALQAQFMQMKSLNQKVELFAANGLWHDALAIAAELYCTQADRSTWTKLLQSVGLSELTQVSIVNCRPANKAATTNFPLERKAPKTSDVDI